MTDVPQCSKCETELSDDTGWAMSTTLADGAPITLYCEGCNPNKGRGWTLADLERVREESKVQRALREVDMMDLVGPDVYFFIKKREERAKYRQQVRSMHQTMQSVVDTLKACGVEFPEEKGQP